MGIGATDPETTNAGAERVITGPRLKLIDDVERAIIQTERRVRALEMKRGRELTVLQGKCGFDQPTDSCGGVHVASVGF